MIRPDVILRGRSGWSKVIPLMSSPIHHMTVIRYYRDARPWDEQQINSPTWADIEAAVRRMDNYCFPNVQLNTTDDEAHEGIFHIIGGAGRWALLQQTGAWEYEDPDGSEDEAVLWASDQGHFCKEKNVLTDIEKVLRITKAYYDTGSYEGLDAVE